MKKQDPANILSCISYECHSILISREIRQSLDSYEMSDDENSEYDDISDSSECDSECNFTEDLDFNCSNICSSQTFQHLVNKRKVHSIIDGINLLSDDLRSDEGLDEDSQGTLSTEEDLDACTDMQSSGLVSNDNDTDTIRSSALDCNNGTSWTINRVGSIEDFERRAVEKKIIMGKIKKRSVDDPCGYTHFQFIKNDSTMSRAIW
eukprot:CAMPEP_0185728224 /NCGR_PEP_ID=MMETSP1171-20130828/3644_1 /TAXON_ID=374046 /ORGANISM="Helicotheca tamensis, Strain CCMP826" /LENGTH=205 /DNA_ID=CAMNT_0028396907 /DNA_START=88 /DNA_END=705 /DNA_ORIENTATION=-